MGSCAKRLACVQCRLSAREKTLPDSILTPLSERVWRSDVLCFISLHHPHARQGSEHGIAFVRISSLPFTSSFARLKCASPADVIPLAPASAWSAAQCRRWRSRHAAASGPAPDPRAVLAGRHLATVPYPRAARRLRARAQTGHRSGRTARPWPSPCAADRPPGPGGSGGDTSQTITATAMTARMAPSTVRIMVERPSCPISAYAGFSARRSNGGDGKQPGMRDQETALPA
jgi:hypothetical protein